MHRVLIDPRHLSGSTITLDDPTELHHLCAVLRLKPGDRVSCFDGKGTEYVGAIRQMSASRATIAVEGQRRYTEAGPAMWLIQSLIKGDRFDWLIQKATELGVARVTPLMTERTVVRLPTEGRGQKMSRWRRIAQEAAKQCGRTTLPTLEAPQPLTALLPSLDRVPLVLIPTLAIATRSLREVIQGVPSAREVAVLVGPEGDFTADEVRQAQAHGARAVSLGRLTLRAETAAIAILSIVAYETRP